MRLAPIRRALDHGDRPDPVNGILETMLVHDGVLPMRELHHARINRSATVLAKAI